MGRSEVCYSRRGSCDNTVALNNKLELYKLMAQYHTYYMPYSKTPFYGPLGDRCQRLVQLYEEYASDIRTPYDGCSVFLDEEQKRFRYIVVRHIPDPKNPEKKNPIALEITDKMSIDEVSCV